MARIKRSTTCDPGSFSRASEYANDNDRPADSRDKNSICGFDAKLKKSGAMNTPAREAHDPTSDTVSSRGIIDDDDTGSIAATATDAPPTARLQEDGELDLEQAKKKVVIKLWTSTARANQARLAAWERLVTAGRFLILQLDRRASEYTIEEIARIDALILKIEDMVKIYDPTEKKRTHTRTSTAATRAIEANMSEALAEFEKETRRYVARKKLEELGVTKEGPAHSQNAKCSLKRKASAGITNGNVKSKVTVQESCKRLKHANQSGDRITELDREGTTQGHMGMAMATHNEPSDCCARPRDSVRTARGTHRSGYAKAWTSSDVTLDGEPGIISPSTSTSSAESKLEPHSLAAADTDVWDSDNVKVDSQVEQVARILMSMKDQAW